VQLGNANTKNFHTKATINYMHNYIAMLKNESLAEVTEYDSKTAILRNAFKERMGHSDNPAMQFNLENILGTTMD
jgi:hypothetical protein